jgi:hypothetical protein
LVDCSNLRLCIALFVLASSALAADELPKSRAPAGGWPVIAWAHGTSGVARICAPSLMRDVEYGEEGLMPMVAAGLAVVATDYAEPARR